VRANGQSRRVLLLVNPKSGLRTAFDSIRRALDAHWDLPGVLLFYQFCQSAEDGSAKARCAVQEGVDTVLVSGGDGTVNTIGRELIGTGVALGVIPSGSGNGFARHFGIPLAPYRAVRVLADAEVQTIDVGVADDHPFFVTCSMAWDASIVEAFERLPVRGILPYVFAGFQEFFEYNPQPIDVELDGSEKMTFRDALVFTIANLTQYGGGARIAPDARSDDGRLELVVALRQDVPKLVANIGRLFDGTLNRIPEVVSRRFVTMTANRARPAPIQIDGELVSAPGEVKFGVIPGGLRVLVPRRL